MKHFILPILLIGVLILTGCKKTDDTPTITEINLTADKFVLSSDASDELYAGGFIGRTEDGKTYVMNINRRNPGYGNAVVTFSRVDIVDKDKSEFTPTAYDDDLAFIKNNSAHVTIEFNEPDNAVALGLKHAEIVLNEATILGMTFEYPSIATRYKADKAASVNYINNIVKSFNDANTILEGNQPMAVYINVFLR